MAVLPLGATEPHNLHLPYSTDTLEGDVIGREICCAAHQRGAKVVLLPTVPYGTQTNMRQLPLALNVNPSTLYRFVTDLIESLVDSGIHKILLLNGHGGNELKPLLRELSGKTPAHLFLCNWYKALTDEYHKIFAAAGRPRRGNGDLDRAGLFSRSGPPQRRRKPGRGSRAARRRRGSTRSTKAGSRSRAPGIC